MMYREGFQMGKISKCEGKTIKLIENNTEEYLSILIVEKYNTPESWGGKLLNLIASH